MKTQKAIAKQNEKKKRKKIGGREWQWVQMSIFPVLHRQVPRVSGFLSENC